MSLLLEIMYDFWLVIINDATHTWSKKLKNLVELKTIFLKRVREITYNFHGTKIYFTKRPIITSTVL